MASQLRPSFEVCFVCQRMRDRQNKRPISKGLIKHCSLCRRFYCENHKSREEGVCEINHQTYYFRHDFSGLYPTVAARDAAGYSSTYDPIRERLLRHGEEPAAIAEPPAEGPTESSPHESESQAPPETVAPVPGKCKISSAIASNADLSRRSLDRSVDDGYASGVGRNL